MKKRGNSQDACSFYAKIKDYTRVVSGGGSIAGGMTVYGNEENLAIVTVDGMSESVKFIALKNIRAVLIRRYSMVPRFLVVALLLLLAFGVTFSVAKEAGAGFFAAVAIETLLALLVLLGIKNCAVRLVTDVNDHHLDGIHRFASARKLLDFVVVRMSPYLAQENEISAVSGSGAESEGEPEE